jgi:uncharacterized membrane protein YraQ (UPF0718 family)
METFFANLLELSLEAAPWLLLGLLIAGLVKAWVPEDLMSRWLGGRGPWPVTKAALIGAPLPLCSCGVVPAALGLHRAGASRGSTISFLIATPETGADSIAVSYALLGPFMTVVRPVAAVVSAVFSGLLAGSSDHHQPYPHVHTRFEVEAGGQPQGACCQGTCRRDSKPPPAGWIARTQDGLGYALSDILDDISLWMAVGLVLAAAVMTFIPPTTVAHYGSGLGAMILMVLIGVPMYICATASTPIAAAMLLAGVSPGTALVFLLAGPATNFGTLGILRRELGTRATAAYLGGIAISSLALGLTTDLLVSALHIDVQAQIMEPADVVPAPVAWLTIAVLVAAAIRPLRAALVAYMPRGRRPSRAR